MSGEEKVGGLPGVEENVFADAAAAAFPARRRRRPADSEKPREEAPPPATVEPATASVPAAVEPPPEDIPEPRTEQLPPAAGEPAQGDEQHSESSAVVPAREVIVRTSPAPAAVHRDASPVIVEIPKLGPDGALPTQCVINVTTAVRDRFAQYQLVKKLETASEPTNAIVIRRAVLAARKADAFDRLARQVAARQQEPLDAEEDFDADGFLGEAIGRKAERGRVKDSQQQSFRPTRQELATYDAIVAAYRFPSRSDFLNEALDDFLPPLSSASRGPRRR